MIDDHSAAVGGLSDFEGLLREALAPIDPPADLGLRVQETLLNLTEIAAEELQSWELSAMRDPRNWIRPAAAVVVGTTAGAGLVLLRAHRHRRSSAGIERSLAGIEDKIGGVGEAVRGVGRSTRRLLDRV